jgi:hypothetical protein
VGDNTDAGNQAPDCSAAITSQGYNLVENATGCTGLTGTGDLTGMDPRLGPLTAANGGITPTKALLPGSPALNAGNPAPPGGAPPACPFGDQRTGINIHREDWGICDIGSYEVAVADSDGDKYWDTADNCPGDANPTQTDTDVDGAGDACDTDDDNDTVLDGTDNCQFIANANQANNDGDGQGDICDADDDNDGVADVSDNCQTQAGPASNGGCPVPPPPPSGTTTGAATTGPTGQRAAALKKCKKKHGAARAKCKKKANLLPV